MTLRIAILLFAASLALAACGNKGPLVLPPEPGDEPAAEDVSPGEPAAADMPPADAGAEADPLPADQIVAPPPVTPAQPTPEPPPQPEPPPDDDPRAR